ncbi:MAG: aminoglycoside 6'-N-acetyltransferase [Eubacterium sp.]
MQDDKICYDVCTNQDIDNVASFAVKLWNDSDYDELKIEFEKIVQTDNNIVYTAYFQKENIAFAHCSIRNEYVEGADTDNVGYLEAIYVEEKFRNSGIASHLIECCENWAKSKGCKQFASDCDINNSASINLHKKYGFNESTRLVHFIKEI